VVGWLGGGWISHIREGEQTRKLDRSHNLLAQRLSITAARQMRLEQSYGREEGDAVSSMHLKNLAQSLLRNHMPHRFCLSVVPPTPPPALAAAAACEEVCPCDSTLQCLAASFRTHHRSHRCPLLPGPGRRLSSLSTAVHPPCSPPSLPPLLLLFVPGHRCICIWHFGECSPAGDRSADLGASQFRRSQSFQ
jgi:hypothetical protein